MSELKFSKDLAADGFTYPEMARMARSGQLERIRRGAYVLPSDDERQAGMAHRLLIEATVGQSCPDAVVSHQSAAVLHGLPIWTNTLKRVHLTRGRGRGGKIRSYVHLHVTRLEPEDIVLIDGIPATSLARTVVDVARSMPMMRAVPIGDAALRVGLTPAQLEPVLGRARGLVGVGQARRSVAFLDGRSESVGESMSRVVFHDHGVPAPTLQYDVFDERGNLVGRSDFCWEEQRTLGEFDGMVKYGRLLKPGESASDVVVREKLREDLMRDLNWEMARWVYDDFNRPRPLVDRLYRNFARGRARLLL